ncbi:MAG: hypothetical protein AAFP99_01395 [Pseudomonadota bacterium]
MKTLKQTSTRHADIDYAIIKSNAEIARKAAIRDLFARVLRFSA